jgi:hypothetical protein
MMQTPIEQTSPPEQQSLQPHSASPGWHSGTQVPLAQNWPQPQGGSQTSGTQTPFSQVWPGSIHGPSQMPPQPSDPPHWAPVQSGAQQTPPLQIWFAAQQMPPQGTTLLAQHRSSLFEPF